MLNTFNSTELTPGFPDPVMQSQSTFRSVLNAMSRPGTIVTCGNELVLPPPAHPAAAAFLLTVADFETPVWLASELTGSAFATWLKFHSSCPAALKPEMSAFAFIHDVSTLPPLTTFAQGTEEYPDRSTTLVIQTKSFEAGRKLHLSGPGIEQTSHLSIDGLPDSFWEEWRSNNDLFPRGVDLVLTADNQLAALPRTTKVEF